MKKITSVDLSLSTHQLLSVLPKLKLMVALCMLSLSVQLVPVNSFAQYTKLLDFNGAANGAVPEGSLFYDGSFLYGTTSNGG